MTSTPKISFPTSTIQLFNNTIVNNKPPMMMMPLFTSSTPLFTSSSTPPTMALTSNQSTKQHSLNERIIEFSVCLTNTAMEKPVSPHAESAGADPAYPGGRLVLVANGFWCRTIVRVHRIEAQSTVTVMVHAALTPGYKTFDDLQIETRFELYSDANPSMPMACSGSYLTDGAAWQKSVGEFVGDVVNVVPCDGNDTVNLMCLGAEPCCGVSSLVNTMMTTMSLKKAPLFPAALNIGGGGGGAKRKNRSEAEMYQPAQTNFSDVSALRIIDRSSSCIDDEFENNVDAFIYVVPASLLEQPAAAVEMYARFEHLNALNPNPLIAITMLHESKKSSDELVKIAATQFGLPASRVFAITTYFSELKRTFAIERPVLGLLLAATQQACENQQTAADRVNAYPCACCEEVQPTKKKSTPEDAPQQQPVVAEKKPFMFDADRILLALKQEK